MNRTVILSEGFYGEIDRHCVPMEREVVIALANSPGGLDFYLWIAWKSWVLNTGEVRVSLFSARGSGTNSDAGYIQPTDSFEGKSTSGFE